MAQKKKKKKSTPQQGSISPEKYIRMHARELPIYKCYMPQEGSVHGMSEIVVSRKRPNGKILFGVYLIDTYCLGVKDVMYHYDYDIEDFEEIVEKVFSNFKGYVECPYNDAHNFIYSAIEFAADAGLDPARDFEKVGEYILEEDTDDIPLKHYPMGHNGKYLLIEGPTHTERKYVKMLKERLGDNFQYIVDLGTHDYDVYEDPDDYEYDDEDESYDDEPKEAMDEMEIFDRIFGGDDVFEKMLEASERVRLSNLGKAQDNDDNRDNTDEGYLSPKPPLRWRLKP